MTISVEEFIEHFDFTHPDFPKLPREFIWEVYRRLRERSPVVRAENMYESIVKDSSRDEWHVIGYEEVYGVLQDPETFSSQTFPDGSPMGPSIIGIDPPDQNRDKKFITPF